MTRQPHQPTSHDTDRNVEPSPIGVAEDLMEEAARQGASTAADAGPEGERQVEHQAQHEQQTAREQSGGA